MLTIVLIVLGMLAVLVAIKYVDAIVGYLLTTLFVVLCIALWIAFVKLGGTHFLYNTFIGPLL